MNLYTVVNFRLHGYCIGIFLPDVLWAAPEELQLPAAATRLELFQDRIAIYFGLAQIQQAVSSSLKSEIDYISTYNR